ncbi:MAG: anthranilate synthase component I, partial [Candidatus Margulisiibacteriota bacterium]
MFTPSWPEFVKLSQKGNLIPVYKEIIADVETPVSAFRKIEGDYSFLLESVEGGEKIARYSFLGTCPASQVKNLRSFPEIREILRQYKPVKLLGIPRFQGGLVGYISYDLVREIEKIPDKNPDDLKLPKMQFLFADTVLAFDHIRHKIIIIANALVKGNPRFAYRDACSRIEELERKLKRSLPFEKEEFEIKPQPSLPGKIISNLSQAEFKKMVVKAKEYIRAGDIIQVVLSQ